MITILDLHVTFESTWLSSTEIVEIPGYSDSTATPSNGFTLTPEQDQDPEIADQCLALVQPQTLDILSLCRNVPKDWALRAPNFQGHPTASPATTARTAAKCHIRRPTAQAVFSLNG